MCDACVTGGLSPYRPTSARWWGPNGNYSTIYTTKYAATPSSTIACAADVADAATGYTVLADASQSATEAVGSATEGEGAATEGEGGATEGEGGATEGEGGATEEGVPTWPGHDTNANTHTFFQSPYLLHAKYSHVSPRLFRSPRVGSGGPGSQGSPPMSSRTPRLLVGCAVCHIMHVSAYVHVCTHTHAYKHIHARMHTCTQTYMNWHTHPHQRAITYTYTHPLSHTITPSLIHTHTPTLSHPHSHSHPNQIMSGISSIVGCRVGLTRTSMHIHTLSSHTQMHTHSLICRRPAHAPFAGSCMSWCRRHCCGKPRH